MENILREVDSILNQVDYYRKDVAYKQNKIIDCSANIMALQHKKDIILAAKEYHKKAIDILYETSIKELEELINDVMATIFYDRNLTVKMELSDSRSKSLSWYIYDQDLDAELSVRDGVGKGVRTVLSFILQSYYLLSLGSKYLFIDEGYSFISVEYIDRFFDFVKLLCKEKGFSLVMISQDSKFNSFADKHYHVIMGTIQKEIRTGAEQYECKSGTDREAERGNE